MNSDTPRRNRISSLAQEGTRIPQVQGELRHSLLQVAGRLRQLRLWQALTLAWLLAAGLGVLLWMTGSHSADGAALARGVALVAGLLAVLGMFQAWWFAPGERQAAQRVEQTFPELNSSLLAALQMRPDQPDGRFGFLQSSVILQVLSHSALRNWNEVVPTGRLRRIMAAQFASLGLLGAMLWGLGKTGGGDTANAAASPGRLATATVSGFTMTVEPGNTEVERGTSLLVLARVTGALPDQGTLIYAPTGDDPGEETRLSLNRSLNDPVYGARIAQVNAPLQYRVELDGEVSPTYQVTVFEYPRLERTDALLSYPSYTGLESRRVQDVRSLSVVEGTKVQLEFQLNKPVPTAELTEPNQPAIVLAATEGQPTLYTAVIPSDRSRKLTLRLLDDAGRANVQSSEIKIQVVPNQPASVKPLFPARDIEASPLEEIDLKATVWDDFGIPRAGVTYSLAGRPPVEVVLAELVSGKNRQEMAHSVSLESLQAQPDELVAYSFWAEDLGPDGQVRRTLGDMYFAEVRHFEEIYRQGEAQPGDQQANRQQQGQGQGQGANAKAAQELADLQKQIINATWKVIRREVAEKLSPSFKDDMQQLAESQEQALSQTTALAERVTDNESRGHVERVTQAMQTVLTHLQEARDDTAREPLPTALIHEQAASQALLKLRAREHEITRQQQQQQQPGQQANRGRSSQQRQQLDQLDLKEDENRYETQRMAQSQQETSTDREDRQVLNRLRELARRQHDLNDQLKDLQSALEAAETEEKKEEIRRQLQRLQEEQEQILRDTDELQTRMDAPENQERMQEQRQQLEQAREQVQRAAESLQEQQPTRAAASGTRAEQSFEELRDEFRRQSSGRFNETVRDIVDQARQLESREQDVRRQIEQAINPDAENRSLRSDTNREQMAEELNRQRQRLTELVDKMQQTITDAEESEPLLAEKLYDAAREVQSQNVPQALDATRQSVQRGLLEDAQQLEQRVGRGIEQVREKIEGAAEAVLGDETESLRRARAELRNLSREVNDELRRNQPEGEDPREADSRPAGQPGDATAREPQEGQPQEGQGRNGQPPSEETPTDRQQSPNRGRSGRGTASRPGEQSENDPQQPNDGNAPAEAETENPEAPRSAESASRDPQGRPRPGQSQGNQRNPNGESQPGQEPGEENARTGEPTEPPGEGEPQAQPGNSQAARGRGGNARGNRAGQEPENPPPGETGGEEPGEETAEPEMSQEESQPGDGDGAGQTPSAGRPNSPARQAGNRNRDGGPQRGATGPLDRVTDAGGFAPFTGRDFREWSDRLRDVEEMVSDPELRAEAARIRDRARAIRGEARRNSSEPNWDLVRMQVANPLAELSRRVNDELLRRQNRQNVIPLDRDQVPPRYSEKTRKYYERLGSGQ
ncbi:MAG: hypothetical protein ACK5TO_03390 [Planctomycetaceae bacterium]